ncbi:hypothetical protein [Mycobacterium sp. MAA66]|uniref:hypothetical protein n=1 Tax=Mycobacterium sp. MAA66 TaxID=3156297 RepID=UPI00351887FE
MGLGDTTAATGVWVRGRCGWLALDAESVVPISLLAVGFGFALGFLGFDTDVPSAGVVAAVPDGASSEPAGLGFFGFCFEAPPGRPCGVAAACDGPDALVGVSEEGEEWVASSGAAQAIPAGVAMAYPTPSATASAPTRPTYLP